MGLPLRAGENEGRREEEEKRGKGREKVEGMDHNGNGTRLISSCHCSAVNVQPPESKFSGYVAANVYLNRQRNRSSRCLHKVSK